MEDLNALHEEDLLLPNLTQYGVRLPFRVAVVGQTDSGKTYSIMRRWLGRKISFWKAGVDGDVIELTYTTVFIAAMVGCHWMKNQPYYNNLYVTNIKSYFT